MIKIGKPIAFGTDEPLPLKGFPRGKYRVRLRPNEFAKVYVKTEDGICEFTAKITDGHWTPGPEMARNIRGQNSVDASPETTNSDCGRLSAWAYCLDHLRGFLCGRK